MNFTPAEQAPTPAVGALPHPAPQQTCPVYPGLCTETDPHADHSNHDRAADRTGWPVSVGFVHAAGAEPLLYVHGDLKTEVPLAEGDQLAEGLRAAATELDTLTQNVGAVHNGHRTMPDLPDGIRGLLAAVLEAIDIPHPATLGGTAAHDQLLTTRVVHARIALNSLLDDGPHMGAAWTARYLRERIAEHPVTGYVTADQAHAALDEGKTWGQAVTLPTGEDQ
ncbi:hypothetical protein HLK59_10125 [Streptomyces sp. S3(2020)]|uniref:hypothetical protein n=1 Tax=Streptomyces sp. S3(2020) TaxID=2732044 RepID=UPI0014880C08|nr:hypothetical protein [Streptomyces sp. S3(2020)]NNN30713.1 hypothetical protein [Streptomyces sp. S3(2020)]